MTCRLCHQATTSEMAVSAKITPKQRRYAAAARAFNFHKPLKNKDILLNTSECGAVQRFRENDPQV